MQLGDRMKEYEYVARNKLTKRTPVIIRVDGRAFHTFTKGYDKPFSSLITSAMVSTARYVADNMHGFKVAYVQSDEISFCITDYDNLNTEGWFNYNISKIISITASLTSVYFKRSIFTDAFPVFDCRAFNIPQNEIANYFLWRAKDWERNSVQMLGQSVFSHKELYKKSLKDILGMLQEREIFWSDLQECEKNGTYIFRQDGNTKITSRILPKFEDIHRLVEPITKYKE